MKLETLSIKNFRDFGPAETKLNMGDCLTVLVGRNGTGKTAVFEALSRLFGIGSRQRSVKRHDFLLTPDNPESADGA